MSQLRRYLFEPTERDGRVAPYSRMDIMWSVALAFALMVAMSLATQPQLIHQPLGRFQWRNLALSIFLAATIILFHTRRRLLLGIALSLVATRLVIGVLFVSHGLLMLSLTLLVVASAYVLLRGL